MKRIVRICVVLTLIVLCSGCSNNDTSAVTEQITTTAVTTEEQESTEIITTEKIEEEVIQSFDSFELIDYMVFSTILAQEPGEMIACDLIDGDNDGRMELFVEKIAPESERNTYYCFNDCLSPCMDVNSATGAAGSSELLVDYEEQKVYKRYSYVTANYGYVNFALWDAGWQKVGEYEMQYVSDEEGFVDQLCVWDRKDVSRQKWEDKEQQLYASGEKLKDNRSSIMSIEISDTTIEDFQKGYENHLNNMNSIYIVENEDVDEDGEAEVCYYIEDYVRPWREKQTVEVELDDGDFINGSDGAVSRVVIDQQESKIAIRATYNSDMDSIKETSASSDEPVYYLEDYLGKEFHEEDFAMFGECYGGTYKELLLWTEYLYDYGTVIISEDNIVSSIRMSDLADGTYYVMGLRLGSSKDEMFAMFGETEATVDRFFNENAYQYFLGDRHVIFYLDENDSVIAAWLS